MGFGRTDIADTTCKIECNHDEWDTCPFCGEYACVSCGNRHLMSCVQASERAMDQLQGDIVKSLSSSIKDALLSPVHGGDLHIDTESIKNIKF